MANDRLRIRLRAVSEDSIPRGGGRALFELCQARPEHATPVLTIVVEAPEFRAAAAEEIPKPNYEAITTEAIARLRENLRAMIEALDGIPDDLRRRGRPLLPSDGRGVVMPEERSDPGPPYWSLRTDPFDPTARGSLFVCQATSGTDPFATRKLTPSDTKTDPFAT